MQFFNHSEFDSPDVPGSGQHMQADFLAKLDRARLLLGQPMHINSGYRTPSHNHKVGGSPNSSHLRGYAADIHCPNSATRLLLVQSLLAAGFNRIGIGNTFVHADNDPNKTPHVMWTYA